MTTSSHATPLDTRKTAASGVATVPPPPAADDHSGSGNWLRDVILGGQDGLVNVLGIALGLSATTSDVHVLLTAGLAATFTESISMGAVGYTSTLTERDYYRARYERTLQSIETNSQAERDALRRVYRRNGLEEPLLSQVVDTVAAQPERWATVLLNDDQHLQPVEGNAVVRSSIVITIACLIGSLLPLVPFMLLDRSAAIPVCIVLAALTLFAVGVYEAKTMVGSWWRSGLRMAVIGLGAAAVGVLVSRLFHTTAG
jgi:VIT1/CCC1 family predicted Fe2+/Mn2+ transporter